MLAAMRRTNRLSGTFVPLLQHCYCGTKGHVVASRSPGQASLKNISVARNGAARGHPAGRSRAAFHISYRAAPAPVLADAQEEESQ
jgi:hypothetical protein